MREMNCINRLQPSTRILSPTFRESVCQGGSDLTSRNLISCHRPSFVRRLLAQFSVSLSLVHRGCSQNTQHTSHQRVKTEQFCMMLYNILSLIHISEPTRRTP